jgi:hypothetical protein
VLSSFISDRERIVTIEDAAELVLRQRHVVRLETRPANIEGKGAVKQRQLVINALRMRPDRIVVGEVRGEEALDMLQAMNTGHDGSLTTIHANSPRDALYRLDTMVAMANLNLPDKAIRHQIASAINLIIQVSRMADGTRRVTNISEITGMEGDVITMQDLPVRTRPAARRPRDRVFKPRHPAAGRAATGHGGVPHRRVVRAAGSWSRRRSLCRRRVRAAGPVFGACWLFVADRRPSSGAAQSPVYAASTSTHPLAGSSSRPRA